MKKHSKLIVLTLAMLLVFALVAAPAIASEIRASKVTVAADPLDPDPLVYMVGDTIFYEMTVRNPIENTETNFITRLTDILPDGTVIELLADGETIVQAPGDEETYDLTYVVDELDIVPLPPPFEVGEVGVRNVFEAEGFDTAGDEVFVRVTRNSRVIDPSVSITKDVSHEISKIGDDVTYTICIENTGDYPLENVAVVDDILGDLSALFPDTLDVDERVCREIPYTIDMADVVGDAVTNTATVSANPEGFSVVVTDWDDAVVDLVYPGLEITKEADTEVSKEGDPINYTVVVSNTGDVDLEVVVDDSLEGILWDDILPAGASGTFEYEYIVQEGDPNPLVNTVTAVGTLGWLGLDNVITAEVTHEMDLVDPEISITKTADPTEGYVGDVITYTIVVENTGDWGLENIFVTDSMFGDITAAFGFSEPLLPGESETAILTRAIEAEDESPLCNFVAVYANPVGLPNEIRDDAEACVEILEDEVCYADETAWAYGGDDANPNWDFVNNRFWGWTNGPLSEGSYEWDIYAGAGQNDLSKGTIVGTLYVTYSNDNVYVKYEMGEVDDFGQVYLGEVHLWVGEDVLPEVTRGRATVYTNAPGQFPTKDYFVFDSADPGAGTTEAYFDFDVSGWDEVYVAAHSVVWIPFECPEE